MTNAQSYWKNEVALQASHLFEITKTDKFLFHRKISKESHVQNIVNVKVKDIQNVANDILTIKNTFIAMIILKEVKRKIINKIKNYK